MSKRPAFEGSERVVIDVCLLVSVSKIKPALHVITIADAVHLWWDASINMHWATLEADLAPIDQGLVSGTEVYFLCVAISLRQRS